MEDLCSDLYALMEERYSVRLNYLPPYREYRRLRETLGPDFAEKLGEALDDGARLEAEAAFAWGLRLGLALERL